MTLNYWKKLHSLYFGNQLFETDAILYKRIRDFEQVDGNEFKKYGLSTDQINLLLQFYEYIPLQDIRAMLLIDDPYHTYIRYAFMINEKSNRIFRIIEDRLYYIQFNKNGTLSFLDDKERYIINENQPNEKYYFWEQIEIDSVSYFVKKLVINYIGNTNDYSASLSSFKQSSTSYNKYTLNYVINGVSAPVEIEINTSTDEIVVNKVTYGSSILYETN